MLTTEGTMAYVDRRIAECMEDVRLLARLELGAYARVEVAWKKDDGGRYAETVALLLGLAESPDARAFKQREADPLRQWLRRLRLYALGTRVGVRPC